MNIETLNSWGEHFLDFAWPMLWQSSLLIVIVFALDFLLAKKIRASVRHALWLVVLVKLLLPPTLALPTGATWWLWPAKPALVPEIKNVTVTYSNAAMPLPIPQSVPVTLPPPRLNAEGWMMLACGAISVGLLIWLIFNWLKVTIGTRQAAEGSFEGTLNEARRLAGLRRQVRLKLVADTISPAVFGLLRPVILLPRALADRLAPEQLRTVLLHEAIHVRRGDVWVNCAQTLLQIFYWWHPLLWLANARLRRLREEAVDDAVMAALEADAGVYAPTLLEVAKFAFRRPLASLGLVGILESRSALRQRIERLVDFRPPRKAGITLLPLCVIFAFGAVALPMGQAPIPAMTPATDSTSASPSPTPASATSPPAQVLIKGRFFWMPSDAVQVLTDNQPHHPSGASNWTAAMDAKSLAKFNERVNSFNIEPSSMPRLVAISGNAASLYAGNSTGWFKLNCTPFVTNGHIELTFNAEVASVSAENETNRIELNGHDTIENNGGLVIWAQKPGDASSNLVLIVDVKTIEPRSASLDIDTLRQETLKKLDRIHLSVSYQNATLGDILPDLAKRSRQLDPEGTGITFGYGGSIPGKVEATEPTAIHINVTMEDSSLRQILDVMCASSDYPIDYAVEGDSVVFATLDAQPTKYETRTFRVDPDTFYDSLKVFSPNLSNSLPVAAQGGQNSMADINSLAKNFFKGLGINLDPPKTVSYIDRLGILIVHATPQDLEVIEQAMVILNGVQPPQVHIKARFIEVPSFDSRTAGFHSIGANAGGILTAAGMKTFLQQLRSQKGVEEVGEPEVTLLTGRQVQMRATEVQEVLTNYSIQMPPNTRVPTVSAQMSKVEFGPIFDGTPVVMADKYTISLKAEATRIQFFGYASARGLKSPTTNYDGEEITLPIALPAIQISSASAQPLLYDGQTLVLFPDQPEPLFYPEDKKARELVDKHIQQANKKNGNKTLLALVTITLIDPAGNRIHPDDEMAFANDTIPPQPQTTTLP